MNFEFHLTIFKICVQIEKVGNPDERQNKMLGVHKYIYVYLT